VTAVGDRTGLTSADGRTLLLLGKPDCHLCHVMREVVERVAPAFGLILVERDVRDSPEWKRYVLEIPVLLLGGRELARHRIDEAGLRQRLAETGLPLQPR
jgi:glutaredoxin-like protein DUF836